jgi:tRNA nucleotidyltransferase (CCA-adding enzyme)
MSDITDDVDLRLSALLHDIGKPNSFWEDENGIGHFYEHPDYPDSADHDKLGAEMAENLMERLKYPNSRINRVKNVITHHMFPFFETEKATRKHLQRLNGDHDLAADLMKIREADYRGKSITRDLNEDEQMNINISNQLLQSAAEQNVATTVKNLAINGNDLISIGMKPGPQLGQVLQQLLEVIVEHPDLNTKEELLQIAKGII